MTKVYLGLGSNIHRRQHITAALEALADQFGELEISSVYESKSVGFNGSNFFNLVVGIETLLTLSDLSDALKKIENDNGRCRTGPKFSPRTLDIDILLYGDFVGIENGIELPRAEITQNAFVLLPMSELVPGKHHPQLLQTFAELWAVYDKSSQLLWPVDFLWRDRQLSKNIM